ncbi:DUF2975 domain-containing protein [Lysinibacillus sp. NPDC048646]|uniref:DUF2975 domain-containing protein n=1 Tax=Lysinibacillus sp. NPDC048646 TaxID=3390574 RepID=UPI003D040A53
MDQTIQSKEFRFLTKGLRTIFTMVMIFTIMGLVVMGGLLIIAIFVPEKAVNSILANGSISATLQFEGMQILLADQVAENIRFVKKNVVSLLVASTLYIAILLWIVMLVRNLLGNLSSGVIFSVANSKKIEWIAYSIVVISLTVGAFRTYIAYTVVQLFKLESQLVSTDWVKDVSFHFSGINWTLLLCGLVIWTIARVFRYGAFLQEEYDATA